MITPDDLKENGFTLDDYYNDWTMDGSVTRFGLNEDGLIIYFVQRDNFHGLECQPISDIETLKQFWFLVTGIQL